MAIPSPSRDNLSPPAFEVGLGLRHLLMIVLVATSLATFRSRDLTEIWGSSGIDAQVRFQLMMWFFFGCLAAALVVGRRVDFNLVRSGPLFWYSLYLGLAFVSTIYSPAPLLTAFRAIQLVIAVVLVVSIKRGFNYFYAGIAVYLLLNWLLVAAGAVGLTFGQEWIRSPGENAIFYAASEGGNWRFASAFGHPSQIANVAAPGAVGLLAFSPFRSRKLTHALIVLFVMSTVLAVSRTAMMGVLGGLIVVLGSRRRMLPAAFVALSLVASILLSSGIRHDALSFLRRGQTTEELSTLSNRKNVYATALARGMRRFWTGEGFRAGRFRSLDDEVGETGAIHAHNAFLEAFMGVGIAGVFLITMVLVSLVRRAILLGRRSRTDDHPRAPPIRISILAMLVPIILFCVMDSGFAARVSPFTLMFLMLCALTDRTFRTLHSARDDNETSDSLATGSGGGMANSWAESPQP